MALNTLTIADVKFLEGKQPVLRVCNWGSLGADFHVDVLTREGLERIPVTSTSNRSHASTEFRLSQLPISLTARTTNALCRRGHLFVRVDLRMGGLPIYEFFHGYLVYDQCLAWPPGIFEAMTTGSGLLRSVTGTDPAAGAEISETVPTNARWRLISIRIPFVTNATVADRYVRLKIDDGTNIFFHMAETGAQAASVTRYYVFSSAPHRHAAVGGWVHTPIPQVPLLFQGYRIGTDTVSLQAGDNYGAPQLLVEEWIEE